MEEALKEAHRNDVAIHAACLIPDQHVIVVAVLVAGQRAWVAFHHQALSKNAASAAQQALRFVAEEWLQLDAATTAKAG